MRPSSSTFVPEIVPRNAALEVCLLGSFQITVGGVAVNRSLWQRKRPETLVKLLALQPSRQLHREQIIDLLWPELDSNSAARQLNKSIYMARRALEPELSPFAPSAFLVTERHMVSLRAPGGLWVDADVFEELAAAAICNDDLPAGIAALDLYTGDLLPENLYDDWAAPRRERLRQTYATLLRRMAALRESNADLWGGIETLRRLMAFNPSDEPACRDLMRLFASVGHKDMVEAVFGEIRQTLRQELDADPDAETVALYERLVANEDAIETKPVEGTARQDARADRPSCPVSLPRPLSSFVGRETERAVLERLLGTTRLVTLSGPGGSGKTRLAVEAAYALSTKFPGGVWFADLAGLGEADLVGSLVAGVLGLHDDPGQSLGASLEAGLKGTPALLVVDNCEHLVDAAAKLIHGLLADCDSLRVIATSREPFEIDGEAVLSVPMLATPSGSIALAAEALEFEAIRLFVDRAKSADVRFELADTAAETAAQICRKLDGLPFAIELAAARVRTFTLEQILDRLDDNLRFLDNARRSTVDRHRSLRAVLDWSYGMLLEEERTLLRRFSVFTGGAALESVEAVCAFGMARGEACVTLGRLVNKSLVSVERSHGGTRYRLLETVRMYAAEKLDLADECPATRRAHAGWFLDLAEKCALALRGDNPLPTLELLDPEQDNFRAALRWSMGDGRDPMTALRLVASLRFYWMLRSKLAEGRRWTEAAIEAGRGGPDNLLGAASLALAILAVGQADYERGMEAAEQAVSLHRATGESENLVRSLACCAMIASELGNYDQARILQEEALELARTIGFVPGIAEGLFLLGSHILMTGGDHNEATALLQESLEWVRQIGSPLSLAIVLNRLGEALLFGGAAAAARAHFAEALGITRSVDIRGQIAPSLCNLARAAFRSGNVAEALACLEEALALYIELEDQAGLVELVEALIPIGLWQSGYEYGQTLLNVANHHRARLHAVRPPLYQVEIDRLFPSGITVAACAGDFELLVQHSRADLADIVRDAITRAFLNREKELSIGEKA